MRFAVRIQQKHGTMKDAQAILRHKHSGENLPGSCWI